MSQLQVLTDPNGHPLGQLWLEPDGTQRLATKDGATLGFFRPQFKPIGQTFRLNGSLVGNGNLLMTLLK